MQVNYISEIVQSYNDWQNHINGTLVFLNDSDLTSVMRVEMLDAVGLNEEDEIGADAFTVRGPVFRFNEGEVKSDIESVPASDITLGFPTLGMTDAFGSSATTYMYYAARRQFRKSLSDNMVRQLFPHNSIGERFYRDRMRPRPVRGGHADAKNVLQIINNLYPSIEDAAVSILDGVSASRALSKNFGLFATDYCEHPVIVHQNTDIGYVNDNINIDASYMELVQEFEEQVSNEVTIYE